MALNESIELKDVLINSRSPTHISPPYERLRDNNSSQGSSQSTPTLGPKLTFHTNATVKQGILRKSSNSLRVQHRVRERKVRDFSIYEAVVNGNIQGLDNIVKSLKSNNENVEEALNSPLVVDDNGYSSLHIAARFDNNKIAMFLIERGAMVNTSSTDGIVPLHVAIRYMCKTFYL